jgi:hypothetical protein
MADFAPQITTLAQGMRRVQTEAGTVEPMEVAAVILADQYLAAKAAIKNYGNPAGLRFTKIQGPAQSTMFPPPPDFGGQQWG